MIKEIVLVMLVTQGVNSANILGITTLLSHSHHLWNEILAMGLVQNGHNVTLISHDPARKKHPNYTVLEVPGAYEKIQHSFELENFVQADMEITVDAFWSFMDLSCAYDIKSKAVQTLLDYPKDFKFDLVLWDIGCGECLFPLIKRFGNPPIVGVSPFGMQPFTAQIMGSHIFNYVPFCISHPTDKVNFWQRLDNTFKIFHLNFHRKYYYLPKIREYAVELFGEDIEDVGEVEKRISVALVNTDHVLDFPQLLPPNIINVGGLQATKPKALPNDLKKILDDAKKGAIYFSLGTNVKPEKMSETFFSSFSKCFAKLPYTVLWKIDAKDRTFPKNVIVRSWMPQNDILAHPNTKVFISHGGALSTQEAMIRGVPLIGLPIFLDQILNIDKIVLRGLGQKLIFKDLSEDTVCATINEVIDNKSYKEKMQLISERFDDQQNTPLERALFWVEYVLRHGNADHLSPAARGMNFIEILNLDIILLLLTVASLPIVLIILGCWCCKSTKTKKVKKN